MKLESVGQTPNSYSQFRNYLSEQADTLNDTLADSFPETDDVYVTSSSFNDAENFTDKIQTKVAFARRGESFTFEVRDEDMAGRNLSERRISYDRLKNGQLQVTDFDGRNLQHVIIEG